VKAKVWGSKILTTNTKKRKLWRACLDRSIKYRASQILLSAANDFPPQQQVRMLTCCYDAGWASLTHYMQRTATYFLHRKGVQPQRSIEFETLRSRVECVIAIQLMKCLVLNFWRGKSQRYLRSPWGKLKRQKQSAKS